MYHNAGGQLWGLLRNSSHASQPAPNPIWAEPHTSALPALNLGENIASESKSEAAMRPALLPLPLQAVKPQPLLF